jgi:hypothetical protein
MNRITNWLNLTPDVSPSKEEGSSLIKMDKFKKSSSLISLPVRQTGRRQSRSKLLMIKEEL